MREPATVWILPYIEQDNLFAQIKLADAAALLVQQATAGQRALFGAAVGWLDNQVTSLANVPGYRRPRSVFENHAAPVSPRVY